ncbi:MAG: glycoside hydrolase family 30 protein [Bacteroidetes bacterium]|nr:glycoside hydrolase family 30 protein [Bacteroidota bacterium]
MKNPLLFCALLCLAVTACQQPASNQTATKETVKQLYSAEGKTILSYVTSEQGGNRLSKGSLVSFEWMGQPKETQICVFVDPDRQFQEFMGIGGALTDAAAETFAKMPESKQTELLKAYYDPNEGIGYSIGRTTIHSCDFSSGSYTYVKDDDKDLASFNIDHDRTYRLPLIKKAIAAAGGKLTLYASPWSPPGWMKDNNDILHGGKLKPEFYQTWANYCARFIKAYETEGIPLWGISIQNEPMATQTWESCIYSAEEERDFLKKFLGPTMQKEGLGEKKIIAWDHNRDLIFQRASTLLSDPEAAKYAWGIGFHWYEDWSGGDQEFENLARVNQAYPDKNLLFTEGCNGPFNLSKTGEWKLGERYGRSMINDFNNGAVGWTDWNILLDETGGPNHVKNFCFAPVHGNTKTGELIYTNAYYYIGHFSKFIRPGAKRIASSASRTSLQATAFRNTDGSVAVVVLNLGDQTVPYFLWIKGQAASQTALPHSITTLTL